MIEQTHGHSFEFNTPQLYKFLKIAEFFAVETEKDDCTWDTLELLAEEKQGVVSVAYDFLEISHEEIGGFCEVMEPAAELDIFAPEEHVLCIACTVGNLFRSCGGFSDSESYPALPKVLSERNFYVEAEEITDEEAQAFAKLVKPFLDEYDREIDEKNPEDFLENESQSAKFFGLMDFLEQKIMDCGGSIKTVDIDSRKEFADFSGVVKELVFEVDEVKKFLDLLRQVHSVGIYPTTDKSVMIDFSVPDFFVHA